MLKQSYHIQEEIIEWRRDFHTHPELGFQEFRTSGKLADELEKLGYKVRRNVGRTGVVADWGDESGPGIAVRADMDALPILEAIAVPYKSQNDGTMHACGHDSHTAMVLGVATLLVKEKFPGKVRFLFQPSEEAGDEQGISGAPRMIADDERFLHHPRLDLDERALPIGTAILAETVLRFLRNKKRD